jgi:hypothetical protein
LPIWRPTAAGLQPDSVGAMMAGEAADEVR